MMALPAMRSLPAPVLLALVCPASASYVRETAGGKTEVKPHLLDEGDELWVELRHQHLVDVFNCLGRKGQELGKSKAAQQSQRKGEGGGEGSEGGGGGGGGGSVCAAGQERGCAPCTGLGSRRKRLCWDSAHRQQPLG
jgi:hypothetical protein